MVTYSKVPQIVYGDTVAGRVSERSNPTWTQRYPAHARPAHHAATDSKGPHGEGSWKIYPADWHPSQGHRFGFKHRNTWYERVQKRDHVTQEVRWVTNGSVDVVMFSS